jgi:CheY-like chemotaxis protein
MMAHILLIDDSEFALELIKEMLKELGHEVEATADPHHFLTLAQTLKPDLALVDSVMPDISGAELVAKLRQQSGGVLLPVMLISASEEPLPPGELTWNMPKPFGPNELQNLISLILSR